MALVNDSGMDATMLVQPTGMSNNGGGFGGFGNDGGWWILLLFLLLGNNGWGNDNNGGGFGGGYVGGNVLYPWLNQSEQINDGFRDQMLNNNITSIRDGINGLSTQLCNCCADMNATVSNGFAQAEIANNARQMADMQQNFAMQTALQNCCCENRAGLADLKYTVATENCADRAALAESIRDVIAANTAGTQRILDQLCADKIDAKNEKIADLERQLTMANLAASQTAQTAAIRAGQVAEIDAMYNRLRDCPVPTMPVYGSQPIFTCPNNNNGCGCGCGCGNN